MSRIADAERTRNVSFIDDGRLVLIQEKSSMDAISTSYIYGNTRLIENRDRFGRLQSYNVSIGEQSAASPEDFATHATDSTLYSSVLYSEAKKQLKDVAGCLYETAQRLEEQGYARVKCRDQISAMINGNYCTYFYYHTDEQDLLQASFNAENYDNASEIISHPVLSVLDDMHNDRIRLCDLSKAIDESTRTK